MSSEYPRVRAGLIASDHSKGGQRFVALLDPEHLRVSLLEPLEHAFLLLLDGTRSIPDAVLMMPNQVDGEPLAEGFAEQSLSIFKEENLLATGMARAQPGAGPKLKSGEEWAEAPASEPPASWLPPPTVEPSGLLGTNAGPVSGPMAAAGSERLPEPDPMEPMAPMDPMDPMAPMDPMPMASPSVAQAGGAAEAFSGAAPAAPRTVSQPPLAGSPLRPPAPQTGFSPLRAAPAEGPLLASPTTTAVPKESSEKLTPFMELVALSKYSAKTSIDSALASLDPFLLETCAEHLRALRQNLPDSQELAALCATMRRVLGETNRPALAIDALSGSLARALRIVAEDAMSAGWCPSCLVRLKSPKGCVACGFGQLV